MLSALTTGPDRRTGETTVKPDRRTGQTTMRPDRRAGQTTVSPDRRTGGQEDRRQCVCGARSLSISEQKHRPTELD